MEKVTNYKNSLGKVKEQQKESSNFFEMVKKCANCWKYCAKHERLTFLFFKFGGNAGFLML